MNAPETLTGVDAAAPIAEAQAETAEPKRALTRRDAPNPITCDYPFRRSAEAVRRHERAKLPTQQGRIRFGITSHR